MRLVKRGQTGISVSLLGLGTGTAHPSGGCSRVLMSEQTFADLLVYGFERGSTWDSAAHYRTYPHICRALTSVARRQSTHLASSLQSAIMYAAGRIFSDGFIIGMLKRSEINVNCRSFEQYEDCCSAAEVRP